MSHFQYYIFDYDGTLCHTHPAISFSLNQTFQDFKLKSPSEAKRLEVIGSGKGLGDTISLLHPEPQLLDAILLEKMVARYREIYRTEGEKHATLFENAKELFRKLKESGKTIIVVSNKGYQAVEHSLELFGLKEFTALVIGEGTFPKEKMKMKPDPMIFKEIIQPQYEGAQGANTLMIGDTKADIQFAKNCGISSAWAIYGYGNAQECQAAKPDFSIPNLLGILDL